MRWAWLNNPTVTLVGLLASAITLVQWVVILAKSIYQVLRTDDKQQRVSIWVVRASLAAVGAVSALSWSAVHAVAVQAGHPGVQGMLYTVMATGCGIFADLLLLGDLREGRKFARPHCHLLVVGLVLQTAALYFYGGVPDWRRYLAAPLVLLAMLPAVMLAWSAGSRFAARLSNRAHGMG